MPRRVAPLAVPDPPLADDSIRLEPLVDDRFVGGFAGLVADPDVVRFTRVPARAPAGFAETWVRRYVDGWAAGDRAGFAIVSEDGEFLGMAGLVALDLDANEGEIGYMVAPAARGRGVAGRALRLVTDWALDALRLARVELRIDVENESSLRVAERAGYVREGVFRSVHLKQGLRSDQAVYALLPGDPRP